jgi:hypothetical protein
VLSATGEGPVEALMLGVVREAFSAGRVVSVYTNSCTPEASWGWDVIYWLR